MVISDDELLSINRAILLRYGIDFTNYEVSSLRRRVSRVVDKYSLESSFDLWRKILRETDFIHTYINEITVGLTEMFRNPELWLRIRKELLPLLAHQEQIKIWHAGCSTGEEVYTMGIVLAESGLAPRTKGLATDVNSDFLVQARQGRYDAELLPKYKENYRSFNPTGSFEHYYRPQGASIIMQPHVVGHLNFLHHNLTNPAPDQEFDIIFCRNVMIYFDEKLKLRLLQQFSQALRPNGFFIIGYFDALPPHNNEFFKLHDP
ncbi:MAG: protein-glutamate O-methyltransferase CheR, partial [Cytophagales bacterium]|nr:protein-glutamate O-methyltransferase CheR [Cytophagales bacterium]